MSMKPCVCGPVGNQGAFPIVENLQEAPQLYDDVLDITGDPLHFSLIHPADRTATQTDPILPVLSLLQLSSLTRGNSVHYSGENHGRKYHGNQDSRGHI